jgi:hypothetical protein
LSIAPHIISASRRCDVPAHHGDWFMQCLSAGIVTYRHPFSGAPQAASLRRDDVIGFVFWSKDFLPFEHHLNELEQCGYPFYCQFTITGLDAPLEPHLPPLQQRLDCFRRLAECHGPARVVWRFDPIVISSGCSVDKTCERFTRMCDSLAGCTDTCVVSFMQHYTKVDARLARVAERTGIRVVDLPDTDRRALLTRMAQHAATVGIGVTVCCQDELVGGEVGKAHCVDIERFARFLAEPLPDVPRQGTRKQCGCSHSVDIGAYGRCGHGCAYCYASR